YADDGVKIDEVNFPDEIFREYVKKEFDTDNNEVLSQEECDNVEKINISQPFGTEDSKKVKSLKGLDLFKNLNGLYCDNNQLTSLDVSKNPVLEVLYCNYNQLTSLDVS
ncbi:hypothetical protein HMPREF3189_01472, partial [Clostridiales bacterium KA00134]